MEDLRQDILNDKLYDSDTDHDGYDSDEDEDIFFLPNYMHFLQESEVPAPILTGKNESVYFYHDT
jgi:hypothetical protein